MKTRIKIKNVVSFILIALIAVTSIVSLSCAKDETPPTIQNFSIPQYSVEGEKAIIEAETSDDRGTEKVDVYLNGEVIGTLIKGENDQRRGEIWIGDFALPAGDNSVSIVAVDKAGNESEPKDSKITVYSKNSLYGYAWNKSIDLYLAQLTAVETDGTLDQYDKKFIDLVIKYPKAGELVPGIYGELLKLPDLSMEKYSNIDEKDIKAIEKILALATDTKYTTAFLSMDSEGIKDKRKYNSAEEALLWEAFDGKNLSDFLEPYSFEKLITDAWKHTTASGNYKSERWKDFDEVTARLNSLELVDTYMVDNIQYDYDLAQKSLVNNRPYNQQPWDVFESGKGICVGQAVLELHFLVNGGGYLYDNFDINKDNAACVLWANQEIKGQAIGGHEVLLIIKNGEFYTVDTSLHRDDPIRGPFKSVEVAADDTWPSWNIYRFRNTIYGLTYFHRK